MSPVQVTLATESCEDVPMMGILAIAAATLVDPIYNGPPKRALPEHKIEPDTSSEGALTVRKNVAASLASPSCTTPAESDNWRLCPAAAFKREHCKLSSWSDDAAERTACFSASVEDSPVTFAIPIGAVDEAALLSASYTFVPWTISGPPTEQLPLTLRAPCTVAPVAAARLKITSPAAGAALLETAKLRPTSWARLRTRKLPLLCSDKLPPPSFMRDAMLTAPVELLTERPP